MGFKWTCKECGATNTYNGSKTTDANSTCSECQKTQRIWKSRIIPTDSNKIQQKSVGVPTPKNNLSRVELNLGDIDWMTVLECMDRGLSTIRNKKEIKLKKGMYYLQYLRWQPEYEKVKEIALLSKLIKE